MLYVIIVTCVGSCAGAQAPPPPRHAPPARQYRTLAACQQEADRQNAVRGSRGATVDSDERVDGPAPGTARQWLSQCRAQK